MDAGSVWTEHMYLRVEVLADALVLFSMGAD